MSVRSVSVALRMEVAGYLAAARRAASATSGFMGELRNSRQASDHLATGLTSVGAVMAGGFLIGVKKAAEFEQQMSEVGAVAGATSGEMGKLKDAALEAGKATKYSATEAAKAEAELAKAGLNTSEILGGALTGALSLAAAGGLDLAEAADVTAKTLNIFHLEGKDATHVADLLAAAANKSATDVHELAMAMKMGGLAANAAGMSVEETVGTFALFADSALVGSDAGTSFKQALMMLQNPTDKSANLMKELGISVYDAQGSFIGMEKLAGVLQTQLGSMTQQERNHALAVIFGSDAMRAANVLYEAGAGKVHEYVDAVNQEGAAQDVAAKKTDNLLGDVERLTGSLETLAITGAGGATAGLRVLTQSANGMVDAFDAVPAPVQETVTVMAGLIGVGLLATAGIVKLSSVMTTANAALAATGPRGTQAAAGLQRAGAATAKFAAIAAGAIIAINLIGAAWKAFVDQPKDTKMSDLNKGLLEFAATGKAGAGTADLFGSKLERLDRDLAVLNNNKPDNIMHRWSAFVEGISGTGDVDGTVTKARTNIGQLDQAMANLVNGGHPDEAAQAFTRISAEAAKQGVSVDELRAGLPLYQAALDGVNGVQQKSLAVTEAQTLTTQLLRGSLTDAMVALGSFKDMFDRFNGGAIDLSKATSDAEAAVDQLAETLGKSKAKLDATGTSFDLTTEAGRNAQGAMIDVAESARDVAQAVYDQTGDVNQASATFDRYKQQLINTLDSMGLTREQAIAMAEAYMKVPPAIITRVMLYGTDAAEQQIQMIKDSLARLPGTKTVNIVAKAQLPSGLAMGALMRADGGLVDFYANGGIRDSAHVAQIVPGGTVRVFGEPETQGEAYIPFAPEKRARSRQVLAAANARLGSPLGGSVAYLSGGDRNYNIMVNATPGTDGRLVGREIVAEIKEYERANGTGWRK